MKKLKITETQKKSLEKYMTNEAVKTDCQTPETNYKIEIIDNKVNISIDLPKIIEFNEDDAKLLEKNLHNALELVLARYF